MFYIQVVQKQGDRPNSPTKKVPFTSKPSEVEARNEKNSKFAKEIYSESVRNIQELYYLERRLFC